MTPHYQILNYLKDKKCFEDMKFKMVYGNKTAKDIWMKEELDSLSQKYKNVEVIYALESVVEADNFKGHVGLIDEELLRNRIFGPSDDHFIWICGTGDMNDAIRKNLESIGHNPENIFP